MVKREVWCLMRILGQGRRMEPALPASVITYTYVNNSPNDGEYTITSMMRQPNTSFFNAPDRTPGDTNGRMLLVNAGFNTGTFYETDITGLCENTPYEFSAWVINVYDAGTGVCAGVEVPIQVKFEIWDESDTNLLSSGTMPPRQGETTPSWQQYGLTFTTNPGQNGCILKLINDAPGGCGNDLALDDIQFRTCGDSVSIADNNAQTELTFCVGDSAAGSVLNANINVSVFASPEYQWQQSLDNVTYNNIPGETSATLDLSPFMSSLFFRVKIAEDAVNLNNDQCVNFSNAFEVQFIIIPAPDIVDDTIEICDATTATLEAVAVAGFTYDWYDAATGVNLLASNTAIFTAPGSGIYYLESVESASGCVSENRTPATVSVEAGPAQTDFMDETCSGNPVVLDPMFMGVNYVWSTSETTPTIEVATPGSYSLDLETANGCMYSFTFQVDDITDNPPAETVFDLIICDGDDTLLDPMFTGVNYTWFTMEDTPTIIVSTAGTYELTVTTAAGCEILFTYNVEQVQPQVVTGVDTSEQPIEILVQNNADIYEYSFNGSSFQRSRLFFEEVLPNNTAIARSIDECVVTEFTFLDLQIPQFFTPNSDGFNDFFQLPGVLNFPGYTIDIFDKTGKLIKRLDDNNLFWDGTLNNNPLPSSDYWYVFTFENMEERGHFTLKR